MFVLNFGQAIGQPDGIQIKVYKQRSRHRSCKELKELSLSLFQTFHDRDQTNSYRKMNGKSYWKSADYTARGMAISV